MFISSRSDLEHRNATGTSPLLFATMFTDSDEQIVQVLLDMRAEVNGRQLPRAAFRMQFRLMGLKSWLDGEKANPAYARMQHNPGRTALHSAATNGFTSIVKTLLC